MSSAVLKKHINVLLKYSKNYCNTDIDQYYEAGSGVLDPSRHIDITPDVLVVVQGVLMICNQIQKEICADEVVKTMVSGAGRSVTPFPFCFGDVQTNGLLNLTAPTLPRSVTDQNISTKKNMVVDQEVITRALLFFTKTCHLLTELQLHAAKYTNQLTAYCNSCVLYILTKTVQHIPKISQTMTVFSHMPQNHKAHQEVIECLIDLTYALYNLGVTCAQAIKLNTHHDQYVMDRNVEKYRHMGQKQTAILGHTRSVIQLYAAKY
ncbi:protein ORF39 [Lake sturgeon herpesvirus]|nr:protein ORF39 [Lake sturgeon herpesvirus]